MSIPLEKRMNLADGKLLYDNLRTHLNDKIDSSEKGSANGVAELDSTGKILSAQLPSYVDDVLSFNSLSDFPATGEDGVIYVAKDTNITYRWGGSNYIAIGSDLALGETASTAYRGDRGKIAYDHASAKGSAYASGLYKITTNAEGHVTGATAVQKRDITVLGIPDNIDLSSKADKQDPVVHGSFSLGRKPESTVGYCSSATGLDNIASGSTSFAQGRGVTASGENSHAEGRGTTASGSQSHAEGYSTVASASQAHAEGSYTTASGSSSHTEGDHTVASEIYSHAEGQNTIASGAYSHAEGKDSRSEGDKAHVEGDTNRAIGVASHAEGIYNNANGDYSHVSGSMSISDSYNNWQRWVSGTKYNVGDKVRYYQNDTSDPNDMTAYICKTANSDIEFDESKWTDWGNKMNYLEIIGNGVETNSNARTLDWFGNEYVSGNIFVDYDFVNNRGTRLAKITDIPSISFATIEETREMMEAYGQEEEDEGMVVNATFTKYGQHDVCFETEKTATEIIAAYKQGKNVIIRCVADEDSADYSFYSDVYLTVVAYQEAYSNAGTSYPPSIGIESYPSANGGNWAASALNAVDVVNDKVRIQIYVD